MKIGLIGNQNSGKTTLFNCLTGMNCKIGNWPGVTIEKKTGIINGTNHEITDLPGIYSLSPYSAEEEVSRKFVFEEKPDLIINIVDSTSIERSLYLTTQLLELDSRIIIALNMTDILEKKGLTVNTKKLEARIGVKVCKISALKETGIDELIKEVDNKKAVFERTKVFDSRIEDSSNKIIKQLHTSLLHKKFVSINILEEDVRFKKYENNEIIRIRKETESEYSTDMEETIAKERYDFIEKIEKECITKRKMPETVSDKLDKILLNKWIAFPIFIFIMFLVYYLSVGVIGSNTVGWIGGKVETFKESTNIYLENLGVSIGIKSLVVDGIIAGIGAVLGFIPQLVILFLCISILETTGYMSRIALLLDNVFRKVGLSGKSLIPFIVGSGCSVPGIMGSRIIENEDERKMTAILTPFIPCSAKLPIIVLFTGYFFKKSAGLVSVSLYFLAIVIIILSAMIMKRFVFNNTSSTYISELPEYKMPNIKYVTKDVFDKIIAFIKRAGSIILICSIVIWFMLSFSSKFEYGVDIQYGILANIGDKISWIFKPMLGINSWGAAVSSIQGLVAKEQVVSSMAVISGLSEEVKEVSTLFANGGIFGFFTASSAYAFMVFNLFSAPCFGAIGAMKKELGGAKRVAKAIAFQTGLAWILSVIVYQVGSRIEKGTVNIANVLAIGAIAIIAIKIIIALTKTKNSECTRCPYSKSCSKSRV